MSTKDYEKIATVLAAERSVAEMSMERYNALVAISNITRSIADVFAQDNPRFDRAKFYDAAGL